MFIFYIFLYDHTYSYPLKAFILFIPLVFISKEYKNINILFIFFIITEFLQLIFHSSVFDISTIILYSADYVWGILIKQIIE